MDHPPIHKDVVFDPATGYHLLRSSEGKEIAIITPLKNPTPLKDLKHGKPITLIDTKIHADVKACLKGKLLLLNNNKAVGTAIPITKAVENILRKARNKA